jgi:meso-butanediol dehydrogenase / (S,S)-butanediol dehydrogenase / diacetyl reductase
MPRRPGVNNSASPVIWVTGGDSGIGLGIARKFAGEGYRVAISGTDRTKGAHALAGLGRSKAEAVYFVADVRREKQLQNAVRRVIERFGRLDVLCANAGIQRLAPIETLSAEVWDDVLSINARGVFLAVKYSVPHLKKTKGSIISIASTGGLTGYAGGTAYCASKAAVVMMTKSLALEFAGDDVRVNCICPGATRTAMIPEKTIKNIPKQVPLRRIGEPEDVAEMALFLASDRARQITGGVFVIDGGITAGRPRLA